MRIKAVILEGYADAATIAAIRASLDSDDRIVFAPVRVADLVARVAFEMGVSAREIVGDNRQRHLTRARFAVAWLARRLTKHSMARIGRAQGDRDHSTIINQVRRAEQLRKVDPAFRQLTDRLVAAIEGERA